MTRGMSFQKQCIGPGLQFAILLCLISSYGYQCAFRMSCLAIQPIRMLTAVTTAAWFLLQGVWMGLSSRKLQKIWVKVLPHINDALLFASAVKMVIWTDQYPFQRPWLTTGYGLLVAYIGAGMLVLKHGGTKKRV